MAERSKEVLSVIEDDVKWLNDAARLFETLAHKFGEAEKSKWNLLTTVYLERAKIHQELAISLRGDAQLMKVDIARKRADDCEDRWWSLYKTAVLETDPDRITGLIRAAEDAIMQRVSLDGQVAAEERLALQEAHLALKTLKRERDSQSSRGE